MDEITSLYFSYMQPPKPKTYQVRKNDTLSKIAKQHNTTVQEIARINHIKNPNIIYPEQILLLPEKNKRPSKQVKLQSTLIPLGSKVLIVATGTPNKEATIEVLADGIPFQVLKEGEEVSSFKVTFDASGQSVTEVMLRPKSDSEFKTLIDKFSPHLGQGIYTEKITLQAQMNNPHYRVSLANDDMNKLGLHMYQTYIKSAYVIDSTTGAVQATLSAQQDGNEIIFTDEEGEPAAKTTLDDIANAFGNMNNAAGGLAKGMEYADGTFAVKNTKGIYLKHYPTGWHGNGAVKTYSMAKWGKILGDRTFELSLVIGAYQIDSAMDKDEDYLDENNITKSQILPNVGEESEIAITENAAGIVVGAKVMKYAPKYIPNAARVIIGILFLPEEALMVVTVGTFVVASVGIGLIISWLTGQAVKEFQKIKGSTFVHSYPLKDK